MKRNVSVVKLCLYVSECVCSKIIKELPGLVGSGTLYIRRNVTFGKPQMNKHPWGDQARKQAV